MLAQQVIKTTFSNPNTFKSEYLCEYNVVVVYYLVVLAVQYEVHLYEEGWVCRRGEVEQPAVDDVLQERPQDDARTEPQRHRQRRHADT